METMNQEYKNTRTGEHKTLCVECIMPGRVPMYVKRDGDEWKAVSPFELNVIESSEFFASAHEFRVKTTKPPLDGSDFGYHLT